MKKYHSIRNLVLDLENMEDLKPFGEFNKELVPLLEILEKINPCNQEYELADDAIVISYFLKLNLFNFKGIFPLRMKVQIIGLPISMSGKGYWGEEASIQKIIQERKGLKVLLNGNPGFENAGRTLSTFVFENRFPTFGDYLNALRSPYRRRIRQALDHREDLGIRVLDRKNFAQNHYKLYLSIMLRTENLLEILPIEFFRDYDAELYEFINIRSEEIMGFIQIKEMAGKLYFLFCGFEKKESRVHDLYYNMLLKIIEIGIEKQVESIEFGQTSEESKLKIGCREIPKYLYAHSSNPVWNWVVQLLIPAFSYKPYTLKHNVFKQEPDKVRR